MRAEIVRDPAFRDLRNVVYYIWKRVIPGSPDPTPVQYDIANTLQECYENRLKIGDKKTRRLLVEAFRGVGKSWISAAFAIWVLYWDPQKNILVVSASKERADAFSTFVLRVIQELEAFQWLTPSESGRSSKIAFDVGPANASHAPSVKSVGITGMITGSRADVIIPDDIEVPNNSETETKRIKLSELVKEFDAVLKPGGMTVYLGTPQNEMSLYNQLPHRGYLRRIWPARFPGERLIAAYGSDLAPMIREKIIAGAVEGAPTDPDRFNELDLAEREVSYGRSGFALQFMLDTTMSDANRYPLKLADLSILDFGSDVAPASVVWSNSREHAIDDLPAMGIGGDRFYKPMMVSPDLVKFSGCFMHIDPAGRGSDDLAVCVTKGVGAMIYCPLLVGLRGGYQDSNLTKIAEIAAMFGVNKIVIESNFGDGMFMALLIPHLKKIHPCAVEEVRHSMQKEKRIIDTLEPIFNQHRLIFSRAVVQEDLRHVEGFSTEESIQHKLFYQISRITREKGCLRHDDKVDVLAMAVASWVEFMKATKEEAQKKAIGQRDEEIFLSWYRDGGLLKDPPPKVRIGHQTRVNRLLRKNP